MANVIIISDNETPAYERTLKYGGIKPWDVYDVAYGGHGGFSGADKRKRGWARYLI